MTEMPENPSKEDKQTRTRVLIAEDYEKRYESDFRFKPWDGENPMGVHTTHEMLECLAKNPKAELDAKVLCVNESGVKSKKIDRENFLESFRKDVGSEIKMREYDSFGGGGPGGWGGGFSDTVGHDYKPLLGGPFYKNLYYYEDYIRMHAEAFYAYNNDPFARAIIQITRDFVIGTGYEVACDVSTDLGKLAMATWKAFEEANDLQEQIDQVCTELSMYGETMLWWLPGNDTKITYQLGQRDIKPQGIIPRVRIIDPSNIVEIVTYPEDITRKLFYVWLTPTQYQIFTGGLGNAQADSQPVQPTLKFIYRQIPADQMFHIKVNSVSNEKRGRSDLYPVFGYLKRLRDSVNYSLISLEKVSAYSIDTTVDGDQTDIDAYVSEQASLGTIPPAGSEFVHSTKIKRDYKGNSSAGGHTSDAYQWALSCIAAGVGIPVSYFGTHLSGGSTRASALVSTEPVAKKMEKRREIIKRVLVKLWRRLMKEAGIPNVDCDVLFPEIITQDRSQKIRDLLLMEQSRWIKPERAASMAAKEMGVNNFDYPSELQDMEQQLPQVPLPLVNPGQLSADGGQEQLSPEEQPGTQGLSSQDKGDIKDDLGSL